PYRSKWPDDQDIPSWEDDCQLRNAAYGDYIFSSYNDFGKYITNFSEWSARRLDGSPARTPEREFDEFESLLTARQLKAFRRLRSTREQHWNAIRFSRFSERERAAEKNFADA